MIGHVFIIISFLLFSLPQNLQLYFFWALKFDPKRVIYFLYETSELLSLIQIFLVWSSFLV